jgi:hypothetical protein
MRIQLEENRQNAAKFHITETKTNTNRGQRIEGGTAANIIKRERESFRDSERACRLRCQSTANDERLCFAREGTEGREGEEDKREKETSIAKKIYINFKGLKLCDFGDLQ